MSDNRPDPDALLSRLANESGNSQRGRLKVFFGANAGVGKTYAMLEAAQALLREGNQPLVGIVETHGRTYTSALLKGLENLPRRTYEHRGITLQEFDLDAALERKPKLLLLDELAHSNAPGSRHEKRWQDVDELLTAGIDVYTTLNVQHLESLNDVVEQITGVKVRETVPDHLLEQADEIILLDLPAQELLQRLKEGKVYTGAQANRAVENFFKTGNLLALRELALRFVAKRVNVAVQVHRDAQSVRKTWATQERLLVAVGPSPSSAKLVRATKRLATNLGAEWIAASVTTPQSHSSPSARERVAENQRLAQSLGAEVVSISGNSVAQAILDYARNRNVTKIIAGKPIHSRWHELLRPSPVDRLIRESGDIDIYIIRGEGDSDPPRRSRTTYPTTAKPYYAAFTFIAASSAVALLIYPYFTLPDLVMIYLLGITTTALYGSWGATLFATFLGVMAFNILFVPPRFTMSVESPQYLLTFTMMSIVALVISSLTLRLRRQFTLSRENEQRTVILHRLSRRLAALRGLDSILQATLEEVAEAFHTEVIAFIPGEEGRATFFSGHPVSIPPGEKETAVAQWVLSNSRPAGSGTGTLESSLLTHLPIRVAEGEPLAVLALMPSKKSPVLQPDQMELLSSLCAQTALALEVDRLEQRRRQAQTEVETERLRSSVLSTVSHDLRTPIASIQGSAETLLDGENRIPKETRLELLRTITEETHRMSGLIGNLLEMTRLEGGG
ncbi:MAG: sensor histidine kinase KdpD, partial [Candidatus Sumerlaeia bacterium]|nr:sensor histidine kinase KdpD [Candidatus Sumerlaeia bacterium]